MHCTELTLGNENIIRIFPEFIDLFINFKGIENTIFIYRNFSTRNFYSDSEMARISTPVPYTILFKTLKVFN